MREGWVLSRNSPSTPWPKPHRISFVAMLDSSHALFGNRDRLVRNDGSFVPFLVLCAYLLARSSSFFQDRYGSLNHS